MHLKIQIYIVLVCVNIWITNTIALEDQGQNRSLISRLNVLSETTSRLKHAYNNAKLKNTNDQAINVVKAVPIIDDIIDIFTNDQDKTLDLESDLTAITRNLLSLKTILTSVENEFEDIVLELNCSKLENPIAIAKTKISSCYIALINLFENPGSNTEQDKVRDCSKNIESVRLIGKYLKNAKMTRKSYGIFDRVIHEARGCTCNGQIIDKVFQYLLGMYIEWLILKELSGSKIISKLRQMYPWFQFVVILLKNDADEKVNLKHGDWLALTSENKITRVVIWSSQNLKASVSDQTKYIAFKTSYLVFIRNDMGLFNKTDGEYTWLLGPLQKKQFCNKNETMDTEGDFPHDRTEKDKTVILPRWGYAVFGIVVLLLLLPGVMYFIKRKRHDRMTPTLSTIWIHSDSQYEICNTDEVRK